MTYKPNKYWEKRLLKKFNLSTVGHIGFSEFYNRWLYKAKIRALKKTLIRHAIDIHEKRICDVGTGTGFWISFYEKYGPRDIIGIDIATISVENLKQKYPKYHFFQGDISSSSILTKITCKFDIVNVFDVLYHIVDDRAFELGISNILSLTKENGFIFISDSIGFEDKNIAEHVKVRSKSTYKLTLEKFGGRIISVYPLYYLIGKQILSRFGNRFLRKITARIDNLLAPVYFFLDSILLSSRRNNLNLIVIQKAKP